MFSSGALQPPSGSFRSQAHPNPNEDAKSNLKKNRIECGFALGHFDLVHL